LTCVFAGKFAENNWLSGEATERKVESLQMDKRKNNGKKQKQVQIQGFLTSFRMTSI
jgi:hypothetical protein